MGLGTGVTLGDGDAAWHTEMRQAPFYGWLPDLSAHDPTSILTLFGLLPYRLPAFIPAFLSIGLWPLVKDTTPMAQCKLNTPQPHHAKRKHFHCKPLTGSPAGRR